MKTGSLKRALSLVLIYIGVFVLIVVLQFSRSPGFSQRVGRLAVSASYPQQASAGARAAPISVKIDFGGLVFLISKEKPAQLKVSDGSLKPLLPLSVNKLPDGAEVGLEGGITLLARADQGGASFSLSAQGTDRNAVALILPYSLPGQSLAPGQDGKILFKSSGSSYALALASADLGEAGNLSLAFADGASPSLSLSRIAEAKPAPVVAAKPSAPAQTGKAQMPAAVDAATYKAGLDAFSAKVWVGLSSARWSADGNGWKDASGAVAFSEKAAVAYLAEASARGTYSDALARVKPLASKNRSSITWLSVPFLGNTVERMTGLESADQGESARLAALVQNKDPALLDKEGLVPFLLDRSPKSLAGDAFAMIGALDASKFGTKTAAAYFCRAMEARSLLADADSPFKVADTVAANLASRLAKSPDGYFIQTEDDGSVDVKLSLAIGKAFVTYGGISGKESYLGLGQSLVLASLGLADASGFLPARLVLHGDQPADRSGSIAPESCYSLAVANPYYPHELSFYRELGAGAWAWTSSPSVTVTASSGQAIFSVSYPEGRAHYMAIYGTKSFSTIKLYGIDYSPDSAFESYDVSGYLYRKASNGLYLKMKHKQPTEKIELYY